MAKKKSKTQKQKKSQQRQVKKIQKDISIKESSTKTTEPKKKIVSTKEVLYNVPITNPEIAKKAKKKETNNKKKDEKLKKVLNLKKVSNKKQKGLKGLLNKIESKLPKREVKVEKVKTKKKKKSTKKITPKNPKINNNKNIIKIIIIFITTKILILFNIIKKGFNKLIDKIKNIISKIKTKKKDKNKKVESKNKKQEEIILPKLKKEKEVVKNKKKPKEKKKFYFSIKGIILAIWRNRHVFYNTAILLVFALLIIGLIRVHEFSKNLIIYVGCLLGFLILVAISHNKHISGKIFTILIIAGMSFFIYKLDYSYDLINNLNYRKYSYKTYYVVTFDNSLNKSIYNISNKKVGILHSNSKNIERKLNTVIDKVTYIEFDNLDDMYNEFYGGKFRAVIVTENEYKFLVNNEAKGAKPVKILYEIEVNALK